MICLPNDIRTVKSSRFQVASRKTDLGVPRVDVATFLDQMIVHDEPHLEREAAIEALRRALKRERGRHPARTRQDFDEIWRTRGVDFPSYAKAELAYGAIGD